MSRRPRTHPLLVTAGVLVVTAGAGAQELRYSITPTAERVAWDDALGLENTVLYGGRAGFVFDRHVELQGFYLTNAGSASKVRDLYDRLNISNPPAGNPGLGVRNYGATIALNFTAGALTPFVRAGGSILRFSPDGAEASDRIAFRYGGGLRFGKPGGLRLNVFAEDLRFRVDRTLLLALPGGSTTPPDVDADKLRSNLAYGAGVSIPLGGAAVYDDRKEFSLSNLSIPVELFGGRLAFADAVGLPRQNLAGVRTGIDFGPLVSLRGFYWRGVNDDLDATQGVQSYGGEAQFNLNAGPGLSPFLIAGGGQLDFRSDYARSVGDSALGAPADRAALILGGGVRLPLGERLQLNVAARDYLLSREGALEDVRERGQLRSNWSFSAGVGFALGGGRPGGRAERAPGVPTRVTTRRTTDTVYVDRVSGRAVTAQATGDIERDTLDSAAARVDTLVVTSAGDTLRDTRRATTGAGYATGRSVLVPVPSEGEIIVRYGPGADRARATAPARPGERGAAAIVESRGEVERMDRDDLRSAVRDAVREELQAMGQRPGAPYGTYVVPQYVPVPAYPGAPAYPSAVAPSAPGTVGPTGAAPARPAPSRTRGEAAARKDAYDRARGDSAAAAVEQRVMARIDSVAGRVSSPAPAGPTAEEIRAIVREEIGRERAEWTREAAARAPQPTAVAVPAAQPAPASREPRVGMPTLYSGVTFAGGVQTLIGGRVDAGALAPSLAGIRLVPELAFGFGSGARSTYVAANALYEFGGFDTRALGRLRPRVAFGVGLLNFSDPVGGRDGFDLVLTPAYGATLDLPALRSGAGSVIGSPALLVEHQGVSLFDVNRLVVGLTWRR